MEQAVKENALQDLVSKEETGCGDYEMVDPEMRAQITGP